MNKIQLIKKVFNKKLALAGFLLTILSFGLIKPALADTRNTSDNMNWSVNGPIYSIVKDDASGITYVGGDFTTAGEASGSAVPLNKLSGAVAANYPAVNGQVNAVIADGNGGWYLGGLFSKVGSTDRDSLVHILADASVDANWSAGNINGQIYDLNLYNGKLYVAGSFTTINGQNREALAVLDATTGSVSDVSVDFNDGGSIYDIAIDNDIIYISGYFSELNGQTRNRIAALDLTGAVTAWNPIVDNVGDEINTNINALVVYNSNIYIAGRFNTVNGQARTNLASFDAAGNLVAWNPTPNGVVDSMAIANDIVYIGGNFTDVNGEARNRLAALNLDGSLAMWNPGVGVNSVIADLLIDGNNIYVSGIFTTIGGQSRKNFAVIATDGTVGALSVDVDGDVLISAVDNNYVFIGGRFNSTEAQSRSGLAAFDANGDLTNFQVTLSHGARSLLLNNNILYVGGNFQQVNGQNRNSLAALNLDGSLTAWNPNANDVVDTMMIKDDVIYIGGNFTNVSGQNRNHLAALNLDGSLAAWNPDANNRVNDIAEYNNVFYIGGDFTELGGQPRNYLASVDNTGALLAWQPNTNNTVKTVDVYNDTVYFGGKFSTVNGQNRRLLAATDLAGVLTEWNPNLSASSGMPVVYSLKAVGNKVYFGGNFGGVGMVSHKNLASVDLTTGAMSVWRPVADREVFCVTVANNPTRTLLVGGNSLFDGKYYQQYSWVFADAPLLTSKPASNITATTATMNAIMIDNGGDDVVVRGFKTYQSIDCSGHANDVSENGVFNNGAFTAQLNNLMPWGVNSYKAYATNSDDTGYGACESFTTLKAAPTVSTQPASAIAQTVATANGDITAINGANASVRGIKFYQSNNCSGAERDISTNGDYSIGAFTTDLTALTVSTNYSYKAYATNSEGTNLGACVAFTTMSNSSGGGGGSVSNPPVPPVGGFRVEINNKATATKDNVVNLQLFGGTNVDKMMIANTADFSQAVLEKYSESKSWNLCQALSGTCPEQNKTYTVYVRYYSPSGDASSVVSAKIIYDKDLVISQGTSTGSGDSNKPSEPKKPEPTCKTYLNSFIVPNRQNNVEQVKKLQKFLKNTQGATNVSESGVYDKASIAAVIKFQEKYAKEILTPLNLKKGNGVVMGTTMNKINELQCLAEKEALNKKPTIVVKPVVKKPQVAGLVCPTFTKNLKLGMVNPEVKKVKEFLQKQKMFSGKIDNVFDKSLEEAVKKFQNKYAKEILIPAKAGKATGQWWTATVKQANKVNGCVAK